MLSIPLQALLKAAFLASCQSGCQLAALFCLFRTRDTVDIKGLEWKTRVWPGAHCFQDTTASQLVQDIGAFKVHWLVLGVGLDAADIVGLHCMQCRHELGQLFLEAVAYRRKLVAGYRLPATLSLQNMTHGAEKMLYLRSNQY